MVAGVLMARYASVELHFGFAFVGLGQVVVGAGLLLWSARHYEELHGPLRTGESPIHPTAASAPRWCGGLRSGLRSALVVLASLFALAAGAQIGQNGVDALLVDDAHALGGHAQLHEALLAGHPETVGVQVRQETPARPVVGVGNVVTRLRAFSRYLAYLGHDLSL